MTVCYLSSMVYTITSAEGCAAFSSKLEQKLSHVQAMYPGKLNTQQYWHLLKDFSMDFQ